MTTFGAYGGWPRTFGGAPSMVEAEHVAMLDALAPGWDVQPGTDVYDEAYAHAIALSIGWACNARLRNQALPLRMLEALGPWLTSTGLRVRSSDSMQARRRKLAAKMRGYAGNTLADIIDVSRAIFGANFVDVHTVAPSSEIVYWPGGAATYAADGTLVFAAPGPPGMEWSSNRVAIGVEVNMGTMSKDDYAERAAALHETLDELTPAWVTFDIGTSSGVSGSKGFICGVGIVGQTLL